MSKNETEKAMTHLDFTLIAIDKLKKDGRVGIHTVYSGFNEAFREFFPGGDPVATVKQLAADGKIFSRPARGGAMICKITDAPKVAQGSAKATLKKMGL